MKPEPPFDAATAHRWFSVYYFGRVWELLDQPERSAEEEGEMVSMCHASLAHWRERPDCGPREMSIGWWQLSRVYAVIRQPDIAWHYGSLSLAAAAQEPPFYIGYAHEALARAAKLAGDIGTMRDHLDQAQAFALQVEEAEERQWLETDLSSLRNDPPPAK
jgi:hypothetical protein